MDSGRLALPFYRTPVQAEGVCLLPLLLSFISGAFPSGLTMALTGVV
jgi:hypothetical protein